MASETDNHYIKKTLRLAKKGIGKVNPNPLVGSVIVKNGKIVGKGYHRCFGKQHAEVVAIADAGEETRGATLYVNLEPCCHFGKTPPCTDAILKAGITRVVVGMVDPNPLVNQQGIKILTSNGVHVTAGVEQKACELLNKVFIKYITQQLPYVTLKIAQSIDGRIATQIGHSQWITSESARKEAHRLRAESDAVIVGVETVIKDNPQLTVRMSRGSNPVRIVLDSNLRIPLNSHLLKSHDANKTIIATINTDNTAKITQINETGAHIWQLEKNEENQISLPALMKKIAQARLSAVMVEGGSKVYTSFLKYNLADEVVIAIAPKILGSGIETIGNLKILSVDNSIQLENLKFKKADPDFIISGTVKYLN